jgi:hypothetical protein
MSFETAGFLVGMLGVGSAFWVLYRRQSNRLMGAMNAGPGPRRRG